MYFNLVHAINISYIYKYTQVIFFVKKLSRSFTRIYLDCNYDLYVRTCVHILCTIYNNRIGFTFHRPICPLSLIFRLYKRSLHKISCVRLYRLAQIVTVLWGYNSCLSLMIFHESVFIVRHIYIFVNITLNINGKASTFLLF